MSFTPEFTVNTSRHDPYRNFKFRIKWDNKYVVGIKQDERLEKDHRSCRV